MSHAKKPPLPDATDVDGTARGGRLEETPLTFPWTLPFLCVFGKKEQNSDTEKNKSNLAGFDVNGNSGKIYGSNLRARETSSGSSEHGDGDGDGERIESKNLRATIGKIRENRQTDKYSENSCKSGKFRAQFLGPNSTSISRPIFLVQFLLPIPTPMSGPNSQCNF
jgi:hypothetical protein